MWRINLLLVFVCLILFTSALTPLTDFERKYTRTVGILYQIVTYRVSLSPVLFTKDRNIFPIFTVTLTLSLTL